MGLEVCRISSSALVLRQGSKDLNPARASCLGSPGPKGKRSGDVSSWGAMAAGEDVCAFTCSRGLAGEVGETGGVSCDMGCNCDPMILLCVHRQKDGCRGKWLECWS